MAQVRFGDVDFGGNSSNNFAVKFFNLKNDNEEAIVRIMHDSVDDFDILTTHEVREDGQYRGKVNCLRDPREDISKCPLCAANVPVQQRMYIHLIHYVKDEMGNIIPQAAVWERSVSYANQIKSYIDNYGPMSDVICKIVRHGRPGDKGTRYEIVPNLNKQVYRDDIYVKDTSLFENYKASGNVVQERSYEELATYVQTGHMPQKVNKNDIPNTIPVNTTASYSPQTPAYNAAASSVPPTYTDVQSAPQSIPPTPGYGYMQFGTTVTEQQVPPRPNRQYY